jgi:hypothetical protein
LLNFPASGSEIIPNREFWVDLPHLVKDGIYYFLYLCKLVAHKVGCLAIPPEPPLAYSTTGSSSSSSSSATTYEATPESGSQAPMDMGGSYGSSGSNAYGAI